MLALRVCRVAERRSSCILRRSISTLPNNPSIYIHPDPSSRPSTSILSLLPTTPPNPHLAIGTTTAIPPTPDSFTENPNFLPILQSVLSDHATQDPLVKSQALALASTGGAGLGSGGVFFPHQPTHHRHNRRDRTAKSHGGGGGTGGAGAGPASAQGGVGGGGVGGWVHVSDLRNPPDYGRIAWPEDIFGSVEVDGRGQFVGENGNYQESGTYRIVTREGILGLSPFLMERLVERLKGMERTGRGG